MLALILLADFLLHITCWLHFRASLSGEFVIPMPCWLLFSFLFIWGVSFTHPMLASFLSGEFLLHIPCWLHFVSFFFFFFICGVSLTHPIPALFFFGEFLLHIRCWLFSSSSSLWRLSLTYPVPDLFLSGEFLLHSPCLFYFAVGRFSYTSHAHIVLFFCFCFLIWGVSLPHPMLASFLSGEFLLHILCWLHFDLGSFSYTSHAGFIFVWRVSLTHPMLQRISLTHPMLPSSFLFFSFIWGVSLTHPVLALILSTDFLLHITCWLHFYRGSLSYPCRAGFWLLFFFFFFFFFRTWGVYFTHPMLTLFYEGSFSYTSRAAFIFMRGVSLTHPVLGFLIFIWRVSLTHPELF